MEDLSRPFFFFFFGFFLTVGPPNHKANSSITVIDQRSKFGAILVLTLIQLSNNLDGGPIVKEKKMDCSSFIYSIVILSLVK